MAVPWIQVESSFLRVGALRLAALLGITRHQAIGLANDLWDWCAKDERLGRITGSGYLMVVSMAAGWAGDPAAFADALVATDLAERVEDGLRIRGTWRYASQRIKAEKDRLRQTRLRALRDVAGTSRENRGDIAATSARNRETDGDGDGDKEEEVETRAEQPALLPPPPEKAKQPKKPRKPSLQENFHAWASERRLRTVDVPDVPMSAARINRDFAEVVKQDERDITEAFDAFLDDPVKRAKDPPCPLWMFAQDWPVYLSKAKRVANGA